ncbi:MAG: FAD-dependent oxidoreductase [Actinomycetales bacterium]|jgi:glycine/D-amino acid oxidase-like deaminating enzyme|nr:FAD-dependent oxidoreductase [Actinomycetales bacterium]
MDEMTFDLVVVGSGTGLLAALTAAEEGLSVLVVEKSEHVGGSTALSGGGFWIPGNSVLREAGAVDSEERIRAYLRAVTKGEVDEERWGSHVTYGPAAVDLMRRRTPLRFSFMREYADYFPELPGGSPGGRAVEPAPFNAKALGADRALLKPPALKAPFPMPITSSGYKWLNLAARDLRGVRQGARGLGMGVGGMLVGREYVTLGQALVAGLLAGVRRMGISLWTRSPLKDLLVERGRVVGVVVSRDGVDTVVRVERGVILAAGGFERNAEMKHRYQSEHLDTAWTLGNEHNTGEVIEIAQAHGADLAFMNESWWFPALPIPGPMPGSLLAERSLPGSIMVNGAGRRFMNEAVNYMTAGQVILGLHKEDDPHIPAWLVFDQRFRNRYLFGGALMPRQALPKAWYDAGVAVKADTVPALAAAVGLPELPATVERFNLLARQGHDDDFGRGESAYDRYYGDPKVTPNPCLGVIDSGPFYAVKVVPGDLGTCGGIRADGFARALRADGSVIEGLYATGNAAGNAFGRVYPGPGATVGQGLSYGYVAAKHAAGTLG